ncbi:MAG: cytochrome c [Pirellulales bacterium]
MKCGSQALAVCVISICAVALTGCQRESREFHPAAPEVDAVQLTRLTDYQAGADTKDDAHASADIVGQNPTNYGDNAFSVAEGKRLYQAFNCYGCHAHGGGDMGPPLMDDKWIYGSRPDQVFSSIVSGRPNGMPAFGLKIPAFQVWQLAAYVRSMSGQTAKDAAPGRDDDMKTSPPENSAESATPLDSAPPATEAKQ